MNLLSEVSDIKHEYLPHHIILNTVIFLVLFYTFNAQCQAGKLLTGEYFNL